LQRKWQARYGAHGGYYCIVGSLLSIGKLCEKTAKEFTQRRKEAECTEGIKEINIFFPLRDVFFKKIICYYLANTPSFFQFLNSAKTNDPDSIVEKVSDTGNVQYTP
jgi:hypothetical protein